MSRRTRKVKRTRRSRSRSRRRVSRRRIKRGKIPLGKLGGKKKSRKGGAGNWSDEDKQKGSQFGTPRALDGDRWAEDERQRAAAAAEQAALEQEGRVHNAHSDRVAMAGETSPGDICCLQ